MKLYSIVIYYSSLFLLWSCQKETDHSNLTTVVAQLKEQTDSLIASEMNDDLDGFLSHYDRNVISMPEYQPTLQGIEHIEAYYKAIFERQHVKTFVRKADEIIDLGKTFIEIGTFRKEYSTSEADTLITQNGKYWNVWDVASEGGFKLKGEAFGFFHAVRDPAALMMQREKIAPEKSDISLDKETPFELKAYNALMEKGVSTRDGVLRSNFFTSDGSFMPFADSTVTGMNRIRPYLVAYSSRGQVTIDSISVYTYHAEYFDEYVLEYPKFRVKWTAGQVSGITQGKGIRIWKRQNDKSLRLYREIGTHNHIE
jgi:ketosteroid isomerase-like protein